VIVMAVLSAIDEDSSCVPRLLTDYILKGQLVMGHMLVKCSVDCLLHMFELNGQSTSTIVASVILSIKFSKSSNLSTDTIAVQSSCSKV